MPAKLVISFYHFNRKSSMANLLSFKFPQKTAPFHAHGFHARGFNPSKVPRQTLVRWLPGANAVPLIPHGTRFPLLSIVSSTKNPSKVPRQTLVRWLPGANAVPVIPHGTRFPRLSIVSSTKGNGSSSVKQAFATAVVKKGMKLLVKWLIKVMGGVVGALTTWLSKQQERDLTEQRKKQKMKDQKAKAKMTDEVSRLRQMTDDAKANILKHQQEMAKKNILAKEEREIKKALQIATKLKAVEEIKKELAKDIHVIGAATIKEQILEHQKVKDYNNIVATERNERKKAMKAAATLRAIKEVKKELGMDE